jgi:GntR family transcriptional regulator, transcriptional repressor for pyruvate dehydrogenase complex
MIYDPSVSGWTWLGWTDGWKKDRKMLEKTESDRIAGVPNVVGKILSFIDERRYEPNERLPSERDFADRFNVSRGAVREALAALESMRVIERRPNSGIYLRNSEESSIEALVLRASSGLPFQPEETKDVFEVRSILELQGVRISCDRRRDQDVDRLREILYKTKLAIDSKKTIEADDEAFHLGIVASTQNRVLLRTVKLFYEFSKQRRIIYFSDYSRGTQAYDDHCEILEAIEARRTDLAVGMMDRHLSRALATWQTLHAAPEQTTK